MHNKPARALGFGLVITLLLAGCSAKKDDAPFDVLTNRTLTLTAAQKHNIRIYTVQPSAFGKTIEASGAVDFDNDHATSVLAPFSGPVTQILVELGQRVSKGQPLAVVSSPDFSAAVSAYSKALVTARNARKVADADKDLSVHNGIAARESAQAQTDAANADADCDAALQALVALNVDRQTIRNIEAGRQVMRSSGIIRAPISGTVVEKLITPGQLLQAGTTPSFTVANLSRVWVLAQISGADVASVRPGDRAEIDTGAGSGKLFGTIDNISALVDPDTRSVTARVVVDNPGGLLRKQMYVGVRIQSRREGTGLLVPVSAILRDDENLPFVYMVRPDGSYARQHVTLGTRTGDQFDVTDGLQPGTQIVIDGAIFLQFMQNQ
ncbi:MAG: efflux RND transporter periplasmic adaptor subunit [Sphingomonas sp.]